MERGWVKARRGPSDHRAGGEGAGAQAGAGRVHIIGFQGRPVEEGWGGAGEDPHQVGRENTYAGPQAHEGLHLMVSGSQLSQSPVCSS